MIFEDKDNSLFGFPMQLHATNQKMGRFKSQNGWILAIDSYLTLSHQILLKEDESLNSLWRKDRGVNGMECWRSEQDSLKAFKMT